MSEIMKPTVIGSKFITFDKGSNMANWVFPENGNSHIYKDRYSVPISILQVLVIPYGDNLRYLVEYIECE